ncbi:metallophosphoesterase [Thiovibrio sp. JS02]
MRNKIFFLASLLLLLASAHGVFIEAPSFRVTRITIRNNNFFAATAEKRIVQISDLHLGTAGDARSKKLLAAIRAIRPDLILLTGDYVQWFGDDKTYERALAFLDRIEAPLGVYAVMGDADYGNSRRSCSFCHGSETDPHQKPGHRVKFLKNAWEILETGAGKIVVCGLSQERDAKGDWERIVASRNRKLPAIILSHTSEIYSRLPDTDDILVLAGDTHGGQLYLPRFVWPLLRMLPDPTHLYGLFSDNRKHLYVSSGLGSSHLPLRLGRPPEIVVFSFKP